MDGDMFYLIPLAVHLVSLTWIFHKWYCTNKFLDEVDDYFDMRFASRMEVKK